MNRYMTTDNSSIDTSQDLVDLMVANAIDAIQHDYDALPRWKKIWYWFIRKTGFWRVLNIISRIWYKFNHRTNN